MMRKIITLATVLLSALSVWAGDLTVDNLSVQQDASFYGAVHAYVPGGDVSMGSFTNQQYGAGTNSPGLMPGASPIGAIHMYAASNAPSGWLLCNGTAMSRTTYSNLFVVIGTNYGAGNGSTTFNLPDLRQRFALGANNGLGMRGGASAVTLTTNQIPSHTHPIAYDSRTNGSTAGRFARVDDHGYQNSAYSWYANMQATATGGGQPHTNMPPYLTVNFIIYAGP